MRCSVGVTASKGLHLPGLSGSTENRTLIRLEMVDSPEIGKRLWRVFRSVRAFRNGIRTVFLG
jgi:hypothetical protein